MTRVVTALMGLFFIAAAAVADAGFRAFVSDNLEAPLRSGPSVQHKIVAMLKSGRPVEALEEQDGWTLVRTQGREGGTTEGWILSRYLMTRLPWEEQLREMEKENAQLKEKSGPLGDALSSAKAREAQLERQLKELGDSFSVLKRNYEALAKESGGYLDLKEAHRVSQASLDKCRDETDKATVEIIRLKASDRNSWFLSGAMVLLGGLLLGLLLGRMQRKRKSSLID